MHEVVETPSGRGQHRRTTASPEADFADRRRTRRSPVARRAGRGACVVVGPASCSGYSLIAAPIGTKSPRTSRRPRAPTQPARAGRASSPPRTARSPRAGDSSSVRGSARHCSTTARSTPATPGAGRTPHAPWRGCRARAHASTSSADVTGAAPSRSNPLVPAAARLRGEPGTAITSTERSSASRTVSRLPPARDSRRRPAPRTARPGSGCASGTGTPLAGARWPFRHEHAPATDLAPELGVLLRIWAVGAVADDGHRATHAGALAGAERAPMSRSVDPPGEPDTTRPRGRRARHPSARRVWRPASRVAGADDADPPRVERRRGLAAYEQHRRR